MMQKASLFTSHNQYETNHALCSQVSDALKEQGLSIQLIDTDETPLSYQTIEAIKQFNPHFTLSIGRLERLSDGNFLCDVIKTPHLSLLQAPSFYFTDLTQSPYSILAPVDRMDCQTIQESGCESVFFMPHAIDAQLAKMTKKEKIYDLVLIGSCYDHESLRMAWRARTPEPINRILDHAIDLFSGNDRMTLAQALVTAWNASGCAVQGVDFSTLFSYLDHYLRGKERLQMIMSITDAQIHIFGELSVNNPVGILGWEQYLADRPNVILHPPLLYKDSFAVLKQAKLVLNSTPYLRHGSHERVFTAFACDALPLTNESTYLREQFATLGDTIFYEPSKVHQLNAVVNELLANEKNRQTVVERGKQQVMQHHTWPTRIKQLSDYLQTFFPVF